MNFIHRRHCIMCTDVPEMCKNEFVLKQCGYCDKCGKAGRLWRSQDVATPVPLSLTDPVVERAIEVTKRSAIMFSDGKIADITIKVDDEMFK